MENEIWKNTEMQTVKCCHSDMWFIHNVKSKKDPNTKQ